MPSQPESLVQGTPNFVPELTQPDLAPPEPSNRSRLGQMAMRTAMSVGLAIGGGAAIGTIGAATELHPQAAAAVSDTYPDKDKPCAHIGDPNLGQTTGTGNWCDNYDWGDVTYNAQNQPVSSSVYSGRGYGYRNCTDWVAWRIKELDNVTLSKDLKDSQLWDDNAPSKGYTVDNTPEVGDVAVWEIPTGSSYGHVAVVEAVNSNGTVNISEYNKSQNGTYATRSNVSADHYIDVNGSTATTPPPPPANEVTAMSSQITPDGNQHIYWATSDGKVRETWFRPGEAHTNLIEDFAPRVNTLSSQYTADGLQHVYVGTEGGEVKEFWFGPNTGGYQGQQILDANSPITAMSSQVTPDGTQHIFWAAADKAVRETWFNPAQGYNTYLRDTSNSPIHGMSSQYTPENGGTQHIYWGNDEGRLHDRWLKAGSAGLNLMADFPTELDALTSNKTPDGNLHVMSATSDGKIRETWSGSNTTGPYNTWEAAVLPDEARALSNTYTTADGTQHIFTARDDGELSEIWFYPGHSGGYTIPRTPAPTPDAITAVSSQYTAADGTQHVFWGSSDGKVYETWFGNGQHGTWEVPQ